MRMTVGNYFFAKAFLKAIETEREWAIEMISRNKRAASSEQGNSTE